MPRQIINLNDDQWRFGQVLPCPFNVTDVYDLPAVTEWLPTNVPGNVRTDLLALNRTSDPFFAEGYQESLWVEEVDWWYQRTVKLEQLALTGGERAFIVFEGLDYLSATFINGQEATRHQGMFSHQIVDITEALFVGRGQVELAVRLWGSWALPHRQLSWSQQVWQKVASALHGSWTGVYPDRSATLKCQMSFGWDFAPPIRAMGLWDDVHLVVTGSVFIAEASAIGQPIFSSRQPSNGKSQAGVPADFSAKLTLDSDQPRQVQATIAITPANFEGLATETLPFPLKLATGRSSHQLQFYLPEAELWQPWDRGKPHLYRLTISIADLKGNILDEVELRTGVRSIELDRWQFTINGQREFVRGLNWVPADSLPGRLRPADYNRWLTLVRESGANFIRVWGGGLREKQAFYDLCDELGLLVWQEFPFACMFLGAYPRHQAYLAQVEAECSAIVGQLRHHPSIVVWCGGNEFSRWRNRPLLNTLADVVRQHDGSRPFIPVSPSFNQGHDTHNWNVWHAEAPIQAYQAETAHFLSEFGLQALPHLDTLVAVLPDPTQTQSWETHHADLHKLSRYISIFNDQLPVINEQLATFGNEKDPNSQLPVSSLQSLISTSQQAQAIALQTAIEHMRRRKGEAGGLCLWQFNEPWPAISWSIVDYFGRPKLAYKGLTRWYSPVLISLKFPVGRHWQAGQTFTAEIWAINDTLNQYNNCQLEIRLDNTPIHGQTFDLPADSAQPVGTLTHHLTASPRTISLTLHHNFNVLCENSYDLSWSDASPGNRIRQLRRRVADWVLR